MKYLLTLLMLLPMVASGAARTLTGDCTNLPATAPTEAAPYDLDGCTILDGDDISGILTGAYGRWGTVALRAPSKTVSVAYAGTHTYSGGQFVLLEDQSAANRLTITHAPVTHDATMAFLVNNTRIQIGGVNLSVSFVGTHPGLGTGKPCTGAREACSNSTETGFLRITLNNGSNPALLDIRANFKNTWSRGISVVGGSNGTDGEATANRWRQANFAGVFNASGVEVNSGVMDAWVDPDRTVVMDPYNRTLGWDGVVAKTDGGYSIGCFDDARKVFLGGPVMQLQYTRRLTGGVTLEYGYTSASPFVPKYIGNSATDPFRVRIKDFGFSGPTSITGLPGGVLVKGNVGGISKSDPAPEFGFTAANQRWLRFEQLPSTYGNGVYMGTIASGCALGNATNNNTNTGSPFIWMGEASRDGVAGQYVTAYFNVTFHGFTPWVQLTNWREYIKAAGSSPDSTPGTATPDRSFGHVLRVTSGTQMPGIVTMMDTNTLTGPGSWYNPVIAGTVTSPGGVTINAINNTITDTRIHGFVSISTNVSNTVISNVDFTGSGASAVMTVGSGSNVALSNLCISAGKQITGLGTVTYEGAPLTLPYTFPGTLSECSITADGVPNQPTGGSVN